MALGAVHVRGRGDGLGKVWGGPWAGGVAMDERDTQEPKTTGQLVLGKSPSTRT